MKILSTGFNVQRRIKQSDITAFEILFREFYSPLCHFAARFVKDMDTAEEIVQDFFYTYWKNREKIHIKISVKSYLYNSIRNSSLKHLEKTIIRQRYQQLVLTTYSETVDFDQHQEMQLKEMQKVIDNSLASLPDRCRLIFCLNRLEGKKYREIAELLGISIKTVEANIGKALQLLRRNITLYQQDPLKRN